MARKRVINVKSYQEELNTSVIARLEDPMQKGELAIIFNDDDAELATKKNDEAFVEFISKNAINNIVNNIEGAIEDEASARTHADEVLQDQIDEFEGAIDNEVSARTQADENLQDQIDELKDSLSGVTDDLEKAIAEEASARTQADQELKEYVDSLSIASATPSSSNVREEWILVDSAGTRHGASVKIYKDSSLYSVYIGHIDDELVSSASTEIVEGSGDTAMCFIYEKSDNSYELVTLSVGNFLEESEFQDGLSVIDHIVRVKIDGTSEEYLTVSPDGVKLSGIGTAISSAVTYLEREISDLRTDVVSADTEIREYIDRAVQSADTELREMIEQEIADRQSADTELSGVISDEEERAMEAEEAIRNQLSALTENALTSVTVNGEVADSSNSVIVINSTEIEVGSDITASGESFITSADTVQEGFGKVVDRIVDDEAANEERFNEIEDTISALTENTLTAVTVNGETATSDSPTITLDASEMNVENEIKAGGEDFILSSDTVQIGLEKLTGRVVDDEEAMGDGFERIDNEICALTSSLSSLTENALTSVTVNGEAANSSNPVIVIDSTEIEVGSDIAASGESFISSADTVQESFTKVVERIVDDEAANEERFSEIENTISGLSTDTDIKFAGLKITSAEPSSTNVKEEWKLVDVDNVQHGSSIKIYKDSSLDTVYLGHVDDELINSASTAHTTGSGETALCFIYQVSDGSYELVSVGVGEFLEKSEFKDGLVVNSEHEVRVKIDDNSEDYLTVSTSGVCLSGVDAAITSASTYLEQLINNLRTDVVSADTVLSNTISAETARAQGEEESIREQLSALTEGALTSVTVNGETATSENPTIVLDASEMNIGSDVTASGASFILSSDTVLSGFEKVTERIVENEAASEERFTNVESSITVVSEAVSSEEERAMEAEEAIRNQLSALTEDALTEVTVNGHDADSSNHVIVLDSSDLNVGKDIDAGGEDFILSADTVQEGIEKLVDRVVDDEEAMQSGFTSIMSALQETERELQSQIDTLGQNSLSSITINGYEANSGNTEITLDSGDILINETITISGSTVVESGDTISEGFEKVSERIVDVEHRTDAIEEIIGTGGSGATSILERIETLETTTLTGVSLNGVTTATSNSTAMTIDGNDILVGGSIEKMGIEAISSADSIYSGFSKMMDIIADDEETTAEALLELHDDVTELCATTNTLANTISAETVRATTVENNILAQVSALTNNSMTGVSVNGYNADINNTAITINGTDITVGSDISNSGVTAITSANTIAEGFSEMYDIIVENGNNATTAITELRNDLETLTESVDEQFAGLVIASANPSDTNVREEWVLLDSAGTQHGESVKIYKDSSLIRTYLGHDDDALVSSASTQVVDGSGDTSLCFIYQLEDGSYELVAIPVRRFLEESEFKDGLTVNSNHEVRVKIDNNSEDYLTVSTSGVCLSGIDAAIESACTHLTDLIETETTRATTVEGELRNIVCGLTATSLSQISINGHDIDSTHTSADIVGGDISVGEDVVVSGATVASSGDTFIDVITNVYETINENAGDAADLYESAMTAILAEKNRAEDVESGLSSRIDNALTQVEVNGTVMNTGNTAVTLDSKSINFQEDIARSGLTLVTSADSIHDGFVKVLDVIAVDEEVSSAALLELHDDVTELSATTSNLVTGSSRLETLIQNEVNRATSAETDIIEMLSGVTFDGLTEITINGIHLDSSTTVADVDGTNALIGEDIDISGVSFNTSADTIADGLHTIAENMIINERVVSRALLDLDSRITELSGSTSPDALTVIDINGTSVSTANTAVTLDGGDILMGEDIVISGVTIASSSDTITQGISNAVTEIKSQMEDDNWVIAAALNDMNYRSVTSRDVTFTNGGVTITGSPITAISETNSGETVRVGTSFEVASTTSVISVDPSNPLYSKMAETFAGGLIPPGTSFQDILIALFS